MDTSLFQALFGCTHSKTTFPLTPGSRTTNCAARITKSTAQTYVACLECGKELPYDWENMQVIKTSPLTRSILALRRVELLFRLRSAS